MYRIAAALLALAAIGSCAHGAPSSDARRGPNRVELCVADKTVGNNGVRVYVDGFRAVTAQHGETECRWVSVNSSGSMLEAVTMGGGMMGPTVFYPMRIYPSQKCYLWSLGDHRSSSAALTPCWNREDW